MTTALRIALLAALAAATLPAVAKEKDTATEDLLRRVEILENSNTDLARRVSELESLIKSQPSESQPLTKPTKSRGAANWQDIANWRQLRRGMTMNEVRELLGEPERVEGGATTVWRWADADVFFWEGKLDRWSEPQR